MGITKKFALFTAFVAMGVAALAAFPAERAYASGPYDISAGDIAII
ncbi:MAG: hypothetical protein K6A90_08680 [Lachnospiraceae bacterium]|nr:hypothetical protein [Lachnospiraceae bacterium]